MTDTDPTIAVDSPAAALQVAHELLDVVRDHPSSTAGGALAALLYSASPAGNAGGIGWMRQVLAMPGPDSVEAVTEALPDISSDRIIRYVQSAWERSVTIYPPRAHELRTEIVAALAPYITASAS